MKRWLWLLVPIAVTLLLIGAADPIRYVAYRPSDFSLSPSNIFSSNILAGDYVTITTTNRGQVRIHGAGSAWSGISTSILSNPAMILDNPEAGKVPQVSGGVTTWEWVDLPTPEGTEGMLQYFDAGNFAGATNLVWDETNRVLTADNVTVKTNLYLGTKAFLNFEDYALVWYDSDTTDTLIFSNVFSGAVMFLDSELRLSGVTPFVGNGSGLTNLPVAGNQVLLTAATNHANTVTNDVLARAGNTGIVTNVVNSSTNWPAGQVGLVGKTNNGDVRIKSLSASGATLTDQGTNVLITVTGGPGGGFNDVAEFYVRTNLYSSNAMTMAATVTNVLTVSNAQVQFGLNASNIVTTNLSVQAGSSLSNASVGGVMFISTAQFTNCCANAATLTNLGGFAVPGNTLTNNGDQIEFMAAGVFANTLATTNNLRVTYGGTTFLDTGVMTASNRAWKIWGTITRTGNSAQLVEASLLWDAAGSPWKNTNQYVSVLAANNGIANTLQILGGSRRTAVITQQVYRVEYKPAYRP